MNFQPSRLTMMLEQGGVRVPAAPIAASAPCCPADAADAEPVRRRARLSELNSHLHCSIIGTCLGTAELRKLVPRFKDVDGERASDVDIHHAAVGLAGEAGPGSRALHKALDDRHEGSVRRFRSASNETELESLWQECLASGEVPGAYWALMTHAAVTPELRSRAFGQVHMLSHLVGAANRADIRRLVALERDNEELREQLREKFSSHQTQIEEMNARHRLELEKRDARLAEHAAGAGVGSAVQLAALRAQIDELNASLAAKERALVHQTKRREQAEQAREAEDASMRILNERLVDALELGHALGAELNALESTLIEGLESSSAQSAVQQYLKGKRVIYVGGRHSSSQAIRSLVEHAGGHLVLHDGGLEDRKGLLAAALPSADLVVFPVDCIDHDSMNTLKRVCERHAVPFHALRSSSVASFGALVSRLAVAPVASPQGNHVSHFCLRHG